MAESLKGYQLVGLSNDYMWYDHPSHNSNANPYNGYIDPYEWVDDHPAHCYNPTFDNGTKSICGFRSRPWYPGETKIIAGMYIMDLHSSENSICVGIAP